MPNILRSWKRQKNITKSGKITKNQKHVDDDKG